MSINTINQLEKSVLYSSEFHEVILYPGKKMIVATWREHSKTLLEQGVKDEISRLLGYIELHQVRYVVVDARHYTFTNNSSLQQWINSSFVPRLMESSVEKYGFIVERERSADTHDHDADVRPLVQYFTSLNEAIAWMN